MSDTVQLPPVVFSAAATGWQRELQDSKRPEHLKRSILELVAALGLAARTVAAEIVAKLRPGSEPTAPGGGLVLADDAGRTAARALAAYDTAATASIAQHAPAIAASTAAWVADETGSTAPLAASTAATDLTDSIQGYVTDSITGLRADATAAISRWHIAPASTADGLRDALVAVLSAAQLQATRAALTETQNTYKTLFRDAVARAGTRKIERIAQPTACDFCASLAGVHWADDPDLYDNHPFCCCEWAEADPDATVDFSMLAAEAVRGAVYPLEAVR